MGSTLTCDTELGSSAHMEGGVQSQPGSTVVADLGYWLGIVSSAGF